MIAAAPRRKANGSAFIRAYRIGSSSAIRVLPWPTRISTGSGRSGSTFHSACALSGTCRRHSAPSARRSSSLWAAYPCSDGLSMIVLGLSRHSPDPPRLRSRRSSSDLRARSRNPVLLFRAEVAYSGSSPCVGMEVRKLVSRGALVAPLDWRIVTQKRHNMLISSDGRPDLEITQPVPSPTPVDQRVLERRHCVDGPLKTACCEEHLSKRP